MTLIGNLFGGSKPKENENVYVEEDKTPSAPHLDAWTPPEDDFATAEISEEEAEEINFSSETGTPSAEILSLEEFKETLAKMSEMGVAMTHIQAVLIDPEGNSIHGMGLDALYETMLEIPWLRSCLSPNSNWLLRLSAIAIFSKTYLEGIRLEIAVKKRAMKQQKRQEQEETQSKEVIVGVLNPEKGEFEHLGMDVSNMQAVGGD